MASKCVKISVAWATCLLLKKKPASGSGKIKFTVLFALSRLAKVGLSFQNRSPSVGQPQGFRRLCSCAPPALLSGDDDTKGKLVALSNFNHSSGRAFLKRSLTDDCVLFYRS